MKLSLTLRALGKTLSNEGHGFSRAVKDLRLDGFSRRGTLFETYRAKSSLFAFEFATDDWKDVPQGLKPSSVRVLWHG